MTAQKIPDDIERWEKKGLREDIDTDAEHVHDIYIWHNYAIEHEKCDCGGEYKDKGHWNPYAIVDGHPVKLNRDYFESFEEAVGYLKGMIKDKEIVDGKEADDEEDEEEPEIPKHPDGDTVTRKGFDMRIHMAMMNGEEGAREEYERYISDLRKGTSIYPTHSRANAKGQKTENDSIHRDIPNNTFNPHVEPPIPFIERKKGEYKTINMNTPAYQKTSSKKKEEIDSSLPTKMEQKKMHGNTIGLQNPTRKTQEKEERYATTADDRNRQYREADKDQEKKIQEQIKNHGGGPALDLKRTAVRNNWGYKRVSEQIDRELDPEYGKHGLTGEWVSGPERERPDTPNGLTPEEAEERNNNLKLDEMGVRNWFRALANLPLLERLDDQGENVSLFNSDESPGSPVGQYGEQVSYQHGGKDGFPTSKVKGVGDSDGSAINGADLNQGAMRHSNSFGRGPTGKIMMPAANGITPMLEMFKAIYGKDTADWLEGMGRNVNKQLGGEKAKESQEKSDVRDWGIRAGRYTLPTVRGNGWVQDEYPDIKKTLSMLTAYNKLALEKNPHITPVYKEDRPATLKDLESMSPAQMRHMFAQMSQYTDPDTGERYWNGSHVPLLGGFQYGKKDKNGNYAQLIGKNGDRLNPGLFAMLANEGDTLDRKGMGLYKNANDIVTYRFNDVLGARPAADVEGQEDELSHIFGMDRQTPDSMMLPALRDLTNKLNLESPKFKEDALKDYIFNHFGYENENLDNMMNKYIQALNYAPRSEDERNLKDLILNNLIYEYEQEKDKVYGGVPFETALQEYLKRSLGSGEWFSKVASEKVLAPFMVDEKGNQRSREDAKKAWAQSKFMDARMEKLINQLEPYVMHWLDNMPYNKAQALFEAIPGLRRNMAMSPEERIEWYKNLYDMGKIRNELGTKNLKDIGKYHQIGTEHIGRKTTQLQDQQNAENDSEVKYKPTSAGAITFVPGKGDEESRSIPDYELISPEAAAFMQALVAGMVDNDKVSEIINHDVLTPVEKENLQWDREHRTNQSMKERIHYFDPYFDTLMVKGDEEGGEKKVDGMPSGEHDSNPRKATYRTVSMGEGKDASWPMKVVDKNTGKVLFTLGDRD